MPSATEADAPAMNETLEEVLEAASRSLVKDESTGRLARPAVIWPSEMPPRHTCPAETVPLGVGAGGGGEEPSRLERMEMRPHRCSVAPPESMHPRKLGDEDDKSEE